MTIPLLRKYGRDVSTKQIAEAADIAEGTIFRVFDDKATLIQKAIETALEPGDVERQLAAIDRDAPLREKMVAAAKLFQERLTSIFELLSAVGMMRPPNDDDPPQFRRPPQHAGIIAEMERLFEVDGDELRCSPQEAARMFRVVAFAGSHPLINDGHPMTPEEIADLILDGVRYHANDPSP